MRVQCAWKPGCTGNECSIGPAGRDGTSGSAGDSRVNVLIDWPLRLNSREAACGPLRVQVDQEDTTCKTWRRRLRDGPVGATRKDAVAWKRRMREKRWGGEQLSGIHGTFLAWVRIPSLVIRARSPAAITASSHPCTRSRLFGDLNAQNARSPSADTSL